LKKQKFVFFALLFLSLTARIFAQEADVKTKKASLGIGAEWNMNSRENFAGGAVLAFNYALPRSFALGVNVTASSNFNGITVIEPAALIRRYFFGGYKGFFVQADAGAYLILEDGEDLKPMFSGGLRGGFRFPIKTNFYIEPYGRIGYPFVFGVGVLTGINF